MPYKLSGLLLNRVDLCPAGANQGATIELFKSQEGRVPQKKTAKRSASKPTKKADSRSKQKQRGDDEDEDEDEDVEKNLDDEDDEDVEDEDEDVDDEDDVEKSDEDDEDEEDEDDSDDDEDEESETKKSKAKKTSKAKGRKVVKAKRAKTAKSDDEDEDDLDDDDLDLELDETVLKSLPAPIRKTVERSQRIAKQALQIATEEKDRRTSLEFIEKAKKTIPNLPGKSDEKGEILKALYSKRPIVKKMADRIVELLKSGDAAIKSMLMSEVGKRRVGTVSNDESALGQLHEKRDELMKADTKLTKEQAMEKAIAANPDLYAQHKVEKRRAARDADVN